MSVTYAKDTMQEIVRAIMGPHDASIDPSKRIQGELAMIERAIASGFSPDTIDPDTGLPLLHLAVGRNRGRIIQLLIANGVTFGPDRFGRWPSVVAAECQVSGEMCDLVVEAEAAWLERHGELE